MREILRYCPSCWGMVISDGENVLHIAVKFEEEKALKFILKQSWVVNLINQKDVEGNTPLHVYADTVNFLGADLVNHPQTNQNAVNKKNMTPLDMITNSDFFR
ncbi:Hypothetical predicted protein [Olea europaea subsp. europaea]|uniref:Uncharacterized protein n=1 Tax=Olea europaea subsp. europaea TaxID=158383 RepID=A0A8S0T4U8_OLEEU|nr:Hypothetical predicted protein [Olea europaea subsp. europaea]